MGFPCGSAGKESACNAGDLGLIPSLGRLPGQGNDSPLQYSCLENPMDRGGCQATVQCCKESDMTTQFNTFTFFISSVQSFNRVQLFETHGLQHARHPCPLPALRACLKLCPSSQ